MSALSRRDLLRHLATAAGVSATATLFNRDALAQNAADPRFLIVIAASGGLSILDGPLAIRAGECATPDTLNTFPDQLVTSWDDAPFRAVDMAGGSIGPIPAAYRVQHSDFLSRRRHDLMVATVTGTSVNHQVAQRRAITGNEAWRGRTLQEMVAWQYGAGMPVPNAHLVAGTGFNESGTDGLVPDFARRQIVADPKLWPLSLDGTRGLKDGLDPRVLSAVRAHRDGVFEPATRFDQIFADAPRLTRWKALRGERQTSLESMDLISKLMVAPDSPSFPLANYGLTSAVEGEAVRAKFPDWSSDPLHAQAALAFLLLKHRVSASVTLGVDPSFLYREGAAAGNGLPENSVVNPPLGFDFSHQAHRETQAVVIGRLYTVIDGLIALLAAEDFGDGTSLWDRTLIYVATEFGRDKFRPAGATTWGTGHHLDNAVMVFSPLVRGGTLLGGVDPNTGLTHGFDRDTGAPVPGSAMAEADIFSGLLGALRIDTQGSGLRDVPAMRRA